MIMVAQKKMGRIHNSEISSRFIFRLFLPFTLGYFLAVVLRNMNIILGSTIAEELQLSNSDLGLLTSSYFLSFSLAQIPLGILLDRYDAKFLQTILLIFAATGTAIIADAQSFVSLFMGRCLTGLGLSGSLLAAYKIYQLNLSEKQQGNYSFKTLSVGILGAIFCSAPLEALLSVWEWRQIVKLISYSLFLSAMLILVFSPRVSMRRRKLIKNPVRDFWVDLLRGLKKVSQNHIFWKCIPFAIITYGGSLAIQSLWLGVWLETIEGFDKATSAQLISMYSLGMFAFAWFISVVLSRQEKWHWDEERILQWTIIFFLLFSFLCSLSIPGVSLFVWLLFYATSSACTLSFLLVSNALPKRYKGRAMTSYNAFVYGGAFLLQWLMGVFADIFFSLGYSETQSLRLVFLFWVLLQAFAFVTLFGIRKIHSLSFRIPTVH